MAFIIIILVVTLIIILLFIFCSFRLSSYISQKEEKIDYKIGEIKNE